MHEARGLTAYISGKSRAPMLQVLSITSCTLKMAQTYSWLLCLLYIAIGSCCDYGIFFDVFMMLIYTLHCISFDHGFRIKHVQHFLLEN